MGVLSDASVGSCQRYLVPVLSDASPIASAVWVSGEIPSGFPALAVLPVIPRGGAGISHPLPSFAILGNEMFVTKAGKAMVMDVKGVQTVAAGCCRTVAASFASLLFSFRCKIWHVEVEYTKLSKQMKY